MPPSPASQSSPASPFRLMDGVSPSVKADRIAQPAASDLADWRSRLIDAGVRPNRVASPDLSAQLEQVSRSDIDTVICSVLDTDPSVPLNVAIAGTYTSELTAGINLLASLTGAARLWITADPGKPVDWYKSLATRIDRKGLKLVPLRGDYPQTDPTLMLFTLLQRRLTPGKMPTEKGVLLIDAATAVAIGRCVLGDPPVRQSPLAVRDHFHQQTHLLAVPMHVSLRDVCEFLQIQHEDVAYRAGDFLRDEWITPDTLLGNGELVIHITAKHLAANPDPCIRCGWCLEACPTRIHPAGILEAAQKHDRAAAARYGLKTCIECGICSYVCPTRLPLLDAARLLRRSSQ